MQTMSLKVNFGQEYQKLFSQVLNKVSKKSIQDFNRTRHHLNTNNNFYTPASKACKDVREEQNLKTRHFNQKELGNLYSDVQVQPLQQSRYRVFGRHTQNSFDMGRTFVNLGNNRYQINRSKIQNLESYSQDQIQFSYADHLDRNTFNINNVKFPLISQRPKFRKTKIELNPSIFYRENNNDLLNRRRKQVSNRKNSRLTQSLEINTKRNKPNVKNKQQILTHLNLSDLSVANIKQNPQKSHSNKQTQPAVYTIEQIRKQLKAKTNDYVHQIVFTNQTQKKLSQMQRNFVFKGRLQKYKSTRNKKQFGQKQKIQAWKHQLTQMNPTEQFYDVVDHLINKPAF